MVAMRESVGERGVSVQKPKKLRLDLWPMGGPCRARAIVGRRGLICDGRFQSEGITGRANHEGHRRPGQTYNRSSRIRNGSRLRPNGYGQVTTALRRIADPRPTRTDAGKALSFGATEPVNGRRWRL